MRARKIALAVLVGVVLSGAGLTASPASASRCGNMPDGYVDLGDISTWASPGEVISYLNSQGIRTIRAGLTVRQLCGGAPTP
jgi:hypothetical protein